MLFEGGEGMGFIDGGVFHYNGMLGGSLDDLTITSYDTPPGEADSVPASAQKKAGD